MTKLEDVVRIFHEPHCEGIITSTPDGVLTCAECGQTVGMIQATVLDELLDSYSRMEVALRELVSQVQLSDAEDNDGHRIRNLQALADALSVLGYPSK
jgi:hypothetical protein